jgi:hypothetical protein
MAGETMSSSLDLERQPQGNSEVRLISTSSRA